MPMIDFTLTEGVLGEQTKGELVHELTKVLLKWEKAPDTEEAASIAWVYVHEMPEGTVNVGGNPPQEPRYRLMVTVPEGSLSERRKAGLVEEVTDTILRAEGSALNGRNKLRVWCIINEVTDGNWGGGGRIFRFEDIAAFAMSESTQGVEEPERQSVSG